MNNAAPFLLRRLLLALFFGVTTTAFQPRSSFCTKNNYVYRGSSSRASAQLQVTAHDVAYSPFLSSYHMMLANSNEFAILNTAMTDNDMSAMSGSVTPDPMILAAGGVAAIALIGLVFLQAQEGESEEVDIPNKANSENVMASTKTPPPAPVVSKSSSSSSNSDNSSEDQTKKVAVATSEAETPDAKDGLTKLENAALDAFDGSNRVGLLASLGRLTGLVRTTRRELQESRQSQQVTEENLTEAAEEMLKLEDQFELGQNKLAATAKQLLTTRSDLDKSQKKLSVTSANLQELQEERKSVRKLGMVAFKLSKERVQKRIRKIRGREEEEGDDDNAK